MQIQAVRTALHRPRPLLDLDYAPDVPIAVLQALERTAKAHGLPLHQLELLGQDGEAALGYVAACEAEEEETWFETVDWTRLEELLNSRPPVRN